jgi:hypothetical protein
MSVQGSAAIVAAIITLSLAFVHFRRRRMNSDLREIRAFRAKLRQSIVIRRKRLRRELQAQALADQQALKPKAGGRRLFRIYLQR